MNILVVDDESIQIETISRGLKSRGYKVTEAMSADEALGKINRDGVKIDMVITDYSMPGMNGLGLLKKIRETHRSLPVIMMTAYSDKELVIDALQNRCDSFIEKPFTLDELMQETERAKINATLDGEDELLFERLPNHVDQINNPLMSILGSAELAMMNLHDPAAIKMSFKRIVESARQISRINREIMKAGLVRERRFETADIETLIDGCLDLFGDLLTLNGIAVSKSMGHHSFHVRGNAFNMEQLFKNLILNAIEAMEDGEVKQLWIETAYDMSDNTVGIKIVDSGCGIPEASLATLFLPNFTTKRHGTGLGLSIVKNIVNNLKGKISVKSMVGKGTAFTVRLPAADMSPEQKHLQ